MMKEQELNKLLDKAIGTKGNLKVPSFWMRKIFKELIEWCKSLNNSLNSSLDYVTEEELNNRDYATYSDLNNKQDWIPDLNTIRNNANNALKSIPSEYITETELESKGYLTEVPSEYVTEAELDLKKCRIGWDIIVSPHIKYLTFNVLEDGSFSFNKKGYFGDMQYSKDNGITWATLASNEIINVVAGDKVLWKSTMQPNDSAGIGIFSSSGKFNVEGNIMSLLYGDNFIGKTDLTGKRYAFHELFKASKVIHAANLKLPATTLEFGSYYCMFRGCTSLITAPELPATTLAKYCYYSMFEGCTSLTAAPELPATTLVDCCYWNMFQNCSSLTTVPEILPATTLATQCYASMFYNCTSLTTAPELPATTLSSLCYWTMFGGCTSLIAAPELPATTLADCCYYGMFYNCTSLTSAPELSATALARSCYDSMFDGCTSLTTAPELPATELTEKCYGCMFRGCTSLTTSPELPATTLVDKCYYRMFYNCTNLSEITMLATDISAESDLESCLEYWVYGVASSGKFYKNTNMTSLSRSISGIPEGWTVVNYIES